MKADPVKLAPPVIPDAAPPSKPAMAISEADADKHQRHVERALRLELIAATANREFRAAVEKANKTLETMRARYGMGPEDGYDPETLEITRAPPKPPPEKKAEPAAEAPRREVAPTEAKAG